MSEAQKWAVITGASSGIGRAIALELALKGYGIVAIARREKELANLYSEIVAMGKVCEVLPMDLADLGAAAQVKAWLLEKSISPDILVNNAGVGLYDTFKHTATKDISSMLLLNVQTLTLLTKELLELMPVGSYIMLVSSTIAYIPAPMYSVYAASKSYVHSLGYALGYELSGEISVTTLHPGMTDTEFFEKSHQSLAPWLKRMMMYPVTFVAQQAVGGMLKRRRRVIPGVLNRILVAVTLISPDKITQQILFYLFKAGR